MQYTPIGSLAATGTVAARSRHVETSPFQIDGFMKHLCRLGRSKWEKC
jgi:hypothetical protein